MIYLTGDIHGDHDLAKLSPERFPEQASMTRDDLLIVLGDFGLLWRNDGAFRRLRRWWTERPYTVAWLDGNHENHDWIDHLPVSEWCGGRVHRVADNVVHLMRGELFTIADESFLVMGGALSVDKAWRTEGVSWWARELPSHAEGERLFANLAAAGGRVDHVLTHTCPRAVIEPMFHLTPLDDPTTNLLDELAVRAQFTDWWFGHWHADVDHGLFHCLYSSVRPLHPGCAQRP